MKTRTADSAFGARTLVRWLLRGLSYCCFSAVFVLGLLIVSWRLVQDAPVAARHQQGQGPSRQASGVGAAATDGPGAAAGPDSRWEESLVGQLPSFHIESANTVIGGIPVDQLVLDANDIELNVRELLNGEPAKINDFGSARLTLRFTTSALRARVVPLFEAKGLSDVELTFDDNSVKVTGKRKLKRIGKVKMSAKARFFIDGESTIGLQVTEVESGPFTMGISSLNVDFTQEVPPLNLGGSFARVVIDRLELDSAYLRATAHAVKLSGDRPPSGAIDVFQGEGRNQLP